MRNSGVPSPEHQILNGNEPRLKHSSGPVDVCGYGVVGSCGAEKISVVILASAHARSVAPTAGGGGGGLGGSGGEVGGEGGGEGGGGRAGG